MYIVNKSGIITEELGIRYQGEEKIFNVSINVGEIARKFSVLYGKIVKLQEEAKKNGKDPKTLSELGDATIDLFRLIFGNENTVEILQMYENDYVTMISDLVPFIVEVVVPKIKNYSESKRREFNHYKKNAKKIR